MIGWTYDYFPHVESLAGTRLNEISVQIEYPNRILPACFSLQQTQFKKVDQVWMRLLVLAGIMQIRYELFGKERTGWVEEAVEDLPISGVGEVIDVGFPGGYPSSYRWMV